MSKHYLAAEGKPGRVIVARVKPGHEVIAALTEIIQRYDVRTGYIPTLLGGFKKLTLRSMKPSDNPDHPIDFETVYTKPVEYQGTGTIAWQDGKPSLHIHLSAGNVTGHLVRGDVVFVTEAVIVELTRVSMARKPDPEVFDVPLLEFDDE